MEINFDLDQFVKEILSDDPYPYESKFQEIPVIDNFCPICGEISGKHMYYGARTCSSCRVFFRRSVTNQQNTRFKCNFQNNCIINSKSRRSCKKCRFEKCLNIGMRTDFVSLKQEIQRQDHRLSTIFTESNKEYFEAKQKEITNLSLDGFIDRLCSDQRELESFLKLYQEENFNRSGARNLRPKSNH